MWDARPTGASRGRTPGDACIAPTGSDVDTLAGAVAIPARLIAGTLTRAA
jgi:hypothetical protein